jgi:Ca-activated chloride channel homolog
MYPMKSILRVLLLVALLATPLAGCGPITSDNQPPRNAVVVHVLANSSLAGWLTVAAKEFNATHTQTSGGQPAYVLLQSVEAGQAVIDMTESGSDLPEIWIPDSPVWTGILAQKGKTGFQNDCASVAQSPLVIALWRPIAESLGWPGRSLGWLDIGSLAADPSAWAYYSGGQFGPAFRLGHTHPGLSSAGAETLLAVVQAALSKKEPVSANEIQQPIVQASVGAFEGAVASFGTSTDALGQSMQQRGASYLAAAVVYESTVIQYGRSDPNIVPIYPFEGTYMATHPACINDTKSAEEQDAARAFRDYLTGAKAQQQAVDNGLRSVNPQVSAAALAERAPGVDLSQPKIIFEQPSVDSIYAVQTLWQTARKNVNLVMILDTSGSMKGSKIDGMRQAAVQFVGEMGDNDYISLIIFIGEDAAVLAEHVQVGVKRQELIDKIKSLQASGSTPLYDSIGLGAKVVDRNFSTQTTNAMVVLTDGLDTASKSYRFDNTLVSTAIAHDTTIFTIAYGDDADQGLLSKLAQQANGNFYLGTEANIVAIYEEMSAVFGGSQGIGR